MEKTLRCPTCGNTKLVRNQDDTLACGRCGGLFEVAKRTCPDCGAANSPQAEQCCVCGRPLDLVGLILQARLQVPADRMEAVRQRASAIKKETETTSQERMGRWWQQEEERLRALAESQVEQRRQERMLLTGAIVFAAVVLLTLLAYALVTSGNPATPTATPTALPL